MFVVSVIAVVTVSVFATSTRGIWRRLTAWRRVPRGELASREREASQGIGWSIAELDGGIAIGSAQPKGASTCGDSISFSWRTPPDKARSRPGAIQPRTPEAYSIDRIPPYRRVRCPHDK